MGSEESAHEGDCEDAQWWALKLLAIKEYKVALALEVALWRLLVGPFPDRRGKSCLAPETLLFSMLGDAHPVGRSNDVQLKTAGRSVPMAGCATPKE